MLEERRRQVGIGGQRADDRRDECGHVEAAVDRAQAVLARAGSGQVDAQHRRERTDGGHHQREDQPLGAERRPAQDQRGDQHHGVGLEQVRRHTRAVADVVSHVVGDGGGVTGVVLGDACLDLAHEVGTDIGGLGEDATADPHEHRQQCGAEPEALQHRGCVAPVDEHDGGRTQEAEADGGHADDAAGAERDPHGGVAALVASRRGDANVRAYSQGHAEVADRGGERRSQDEEQRPPDANPGVAGKQEQHPEDQHDEHGKGPELPVQVGRGALLDGQRDGPHLLGALARGEHLPAEQSRHDQRRHRNQRHDDDIGEVVAGQRDGRAALLSPDERGHSSSLTWPAVMRPANTRYPRAALAAGT